LKDANFLKDVNLIKTFLVAKRLNNSLDKNYPTTCVSAIDQNSRSHKGKISLICQAAGTILLNLYDNEFNS
jgi:hypothetical protein